MEEHSQQIQIKNNLRIVGGSLFAGYLLAACSYGASGFDDSVEGIPWAVVLGMLGLCAGAFVASTEIFRWKTMKRAFAEISDLGCPGCRGTLRSEHRAPAQLRTHE